MGRTFSRLQALGVRSFADCRRLPRADLGRRLANDLLSLMDRALGRAPDPQAIFEPEPHFTRRLDFAEPSDRLEQVAAGFDRLLGEMCGFLAGREAGVFRFEVMLAHDQRRALQPRGGGQPHGDGQRRGGEGSAREADRLPATRFTMALLSPSRDAAHLAALLHERLERISLAHPVTHIALQTLEIVTLTPSSASLFEGLPPRALHNQPQAFDQPQASNPPQALFAPPRSLRRGAWGEVRDEASTMTPAIAALVERLRARLEVPAPAADQVPDRAVVYRPHVRADHRPEQATQAASLVAEAGARTAIRPTGDVASRDATRLPRPLWLLATPEPLSLRPWHEERGERDELVLFHRDVPLEIHGKPERVEGGWWDGDDVGRDYFMATTPSGAQRWIFRARRGGRAYWYLHGLFG